MTNAITVTPLPMHGPLPEGARLCRQRARSMAPEYEAFCGPGLTIHETVDDALALLGWFARVHYEVSPQPITIHPTDKGRYMIGY